MIQLIIETQKQKYNKGIVAVFLANRTKSVKSINSIIDVPNLKPHFTCTLLNNFRDSVLSCKNNITWLSVIMWVEFVVGPLLCSERFFSGYYGFPLSSKTNISKFQFDQESGRRRTTLWMCYLQIIIYSLFIYLFIYIVIIISFSFRSWHVYLLQYCKFI